ncbi:hypothetical protein HNV08_14990 [Winogradskyella eckloniae]|uniref:hypothetical protein n=1 Tax=Winogradskyella eckloniae TaxID=1089306 RepID=UPI001565FFFE|nr:hypothetical protein [Winogradskyella eckloniae]NRD21362.1 hypothetical protein [Winogradskyella eckloniae]
MSFNLIDRVLYLNKRGITKPLEDVYQWIATHETDIVNHFISDEEVYYWKIISSKHFKAIIDEAHTDWVLIISKQKPFKIIGKLYSVSENLIGIKNHSKLSTFWVLKSDFEGLKITDNPIYLQSPHHFKSAFHAINYDFKRLVSKLKNPKIKLTAINVDPKSKGRTQRIR